MLNKKERNIILLDTAKPNPFVPQHPHVPWWKKCNEHSKKNTNFIEMGMIGKYVT